MYVCVKCGRLFNDEEVPTRKERHTELEGYWYETFMDDCPCGGTLEEAKQCAVCGEYHCEDDLIEEVCPFCFNHHKTAENIEAYVNEFETEKCSFEINAAFEYAVVVVFNALAASFAFCANLAICSEFYPETILISFKHLSKS